MGKVLDTAGVTEDLRYRVTEYRSNIRHCQQALIDIRGSLNKDHRGYRKRTTVFILNVSLVPFSYQTEAIKVIQFFTLASGFCSF